MAQFHLNAIGSHDGIDRKVCDLYSGNGGRVSSE